MGAASRLPTQLQIWDHVAAAEAQVYDLAESWIATRRPYEEAE